MRKSRYVAALALLAAMSLGSRVHAMDRGPILANNILGGAAAGTLTGLAAGTLAYGLDNNYNPEYLLSGAVYGFVGGALLGGGIGVYEISTQRVDTGFTVSEYLAGGTGIGALIGTVVAVIPYMRDGDPEDFTVGAGLGGLIGASLGLTFAVLDISAREPGGGDVLLSGRIGVLDVASRKAVTEPGTQGTVYYSCRMAEFRF